MNKNIKFSNLHYVPLIQFISNLSKIILSQKKKKKNNNNNSWYYIYIFFVANNGKKHPKIDKNS